MKGIMRYLLIGCAALLIGICALIAALPTLASTQWGNYLIVSLVNETIPGSVKVERFSLGWFGGQKIEGMTLHDPNGNAVIAFESFEVDTPLFALFKKDFVGPSAQIKGLNARIENRESGLTNLEECLGSDIARLKLATSQSIELKDVSLEILTPSAGGSLSIKAEGQTQQDALAGSFRVNVELNDSRTNWEVDVKGFPVGLMDAWVSAQHPEMSGVLQDMLGDSLEIMGNETSQNGEISWSVKTKSEKFDLLCEARAEEDPRWMQITADGSYTFDNMPVPYRFNTRIHKPLHISRLAQSILQPVELQLSLENLPTVVIDTLLGFAEKNVENALGNHVTLRIKASGVDSHTLKMSLMSDKVDIPEIALSVDQDLVLSDVSELGEYSGKLDVEKLIFKSAQHNSSIHSLSIPWHIQNGMDAVKLSFSGKTAIPSYEEGKFSGELDAQSFKTLSEAKIILKLSGDNVPAAFLEFLSGRSEVEPVFGRSLDFDIALNLENLDGSILGTLQGDNAHISLDSEVKDGILKLREPFVAELKGTKELGPLVLSRYAPVFNELISSDQLIVAKISPEGFAFPLSPFATDKIQMDNIVISMGNLRFNNGGDIKSLLSLLRAPPAEQVSVWTTPVYLSVQNGVLQIKRTDMLFADRYPIASWGKIDFPADKVNVVLGLTGDALSQAFNLQGLDSKMMVQVPIKGTIKKAKVDSTKVTTRIASIVAQHQGGAKGLIIGTVLDLAKGREEKIPEPTTAPFPWANRLPQQENDVSYREPRENPAPTLRKEASKLLKNIFR